MEVVGLIPAAGEGTRLAPLPCSKELFPVGFAPHPQRGTPHPKVVAAYLLEHMQRAGAEKLYLVLRNGKWDIPAYFGDGSVYGIQLAYLMMQRPYGCPFSLDQAYAFVRRQRVVFGFPDILISADGAYTALLQRQQETGAEVVLGCFPVAAAHKWDMVELAQDGRVTSVLPKPSGSGFTYAWAFACWAPGFTEFMHVYLQEVTPGLLAAGGELSLGEVLEAAICSGLQVQSVCFAEDACLDVGTPEDLHKAICRLSCSSWV